VWKGAAMEKKNPKSAIAVCPLCKSPITAQQRPSVKFNNGQEVHAECYNNFEEEEAERQRLG
jgi:hypothetical protein